MRSGCREKGSRCRITLEVLLYISEEIVKLFSEAIRIPLGPTHGDIKSHLEMRLDRDYDPDAIDDELRADIMRIIPEKAPEMRAGASDTSPIQA